MSEIFPYNTRVVFLDEFAELQEARVADFDVSTQNYKLEFFSYKYSSPYISVEKNLVDLNIPTFDTEEEALCWMECEVRDNCIDNRRFAFIEDDSEMCHYEDRRSRGCCGFFDEEIIVMGRRAMIGCNYGH